MSSRTREPRFRKTVGSVPLEQIKVDGIESGGYQRPVNDDRAIGMAMEFSWDEFGVITVSDRGDGYFWLVDGQHRTAALDLADGVNRKYAPALVYTGMTREDEARMYVSLNTKRKQTSALYAWQARLSFDEDVQTITTIVDNMGLHIGSGSSPKAIAAVAKLEEIYADFGPKTLQETLTTIIRCYHYGERANALFIKGLALVIGCYDQHDDGLDLDILVGHVRTTTMTRWYTRAKEASAVNSGNQDVWMARMIVDAYNSRLSKPKQLKPFDEVYAAFLSAKRSSAAHAFYERKKNSIHRARQAKPGSWLRSSRRQP